MKTLGVTALAGALMLCAAPMWAAIMIYPKFVDFGQTARVQEMTLVNPSPEETVTYRVRFKYARQNPDGTYTDVEQPGFTTAKDLVRFSPRSITLAPGKSQRVKLLRRIPADTPPGEYTGYIVFTQIPDEKPLQKASSSGAPGVRIELTAIPSFSIPVILTHGETKPDAPELSFLGLHTPEPGKPQARVRLVRTGGADIPQSRTLRGDISVWADGRLAGVIKGKYLLAGNPYVDAAVPLDPAVAAPGTAVKILFTEPSEQDGADVSRVLARAEGKL